MEREDQLRGSRRFCLVPVRRFFALYVRASGPVTALATCYGGRRLLEIGMRRFPEFDELRLVTGAAAFRANVLTAVLSRDCPRTYRCR